MPAYRLSNDGGVLGDYQDSMPIVGGVAEQSLLPLGRANGERANSLSSM